MGIMVKRTRIIGTDTIVYSAWAEADGPFSGTGGTITSNDGKWYIRIGTDPDGELYENLPIGEERSKAVKKAYAERYGIAYAAIMKAFPETVDRLSKLDGGEITITSRYWGHVKDETKVFSEKE